MKVAKDLSHLTSVLFLLKDAHYSTVTRQSSPAFLGGDSLVGNTCGCDEVRQCKLWVADLSRMRQFVQKCPDKPGATT